jgi:ABC-type multidrug transport system fused ATPase/permease subunit
MAKVVGAILYVIVVTPLFLVALVPIIVFYVRTQRYYIKTSRELARLDNISRSPIYALFGETIDGLSTIRAYKMEERLSARNARLLDDNQRAYFLTFSANCWLAFRLEFAGTLIVVIASALAVLGRPSSGAGTSVETSSGAGTSVETYAGLAGLAISLTLSITQSINWSVRMASDLESQMVSVERIHDFITMPKEKEHHTAGDPPSTWPARGDISFVNVSMRYREGLPLVLKSVSLDICGRSKIGVVGRTGSGKSSLVAALLRLVEISSGQVLIDGIEVGSIGLFALRSRISVIPQDPVLFAGTIRLNVDPFSQHTDLVLSETLRNVGLVGVSLDDNVEDEGANLSVGQRQIICIARALVEKAAIIVMDEATASVDMESDALIQHAVRRISHAATTITVAHRLNTILDSDKVLVMSDGCVAEFDTPTRLLENRDSMFSALVHDWRR